MFNNYARVLGAAATAGILAVVFSFAAVVVSAQVYDANADFNASLDPPGPGGTNPNGVWTYSWSVGLFGPQTPFPYLDDPATVNCSVESMWRDLSIDDRWSPTVAKTVYGPCVDGNVTFGRDELILVGGGLVGPNDGYAHVVFTSPGDATCLVDATFIGRQHFANADVHVLFNGVSLFDDVILADGLSKRFSDSYFMSAGDTFSFVVGQNGLPVLHSGNIALEAIIDCTPSDFDGDGVPDDLDPCPENPQVAGHIEFTGDLLVATGDDGLASVELQGLLSDGAMAIAGEEIVFSVVGEQGTFTPDCPGITDASGVAQCALDEIPPDLYRVTATFEEVAGCWDGASDEAFLVVFDPDQPRATGGGFFYPDAESTQPGEAGGDKANFGFVVYNDQQGSADGNLEFQYRAADINLASQSMEWYTLSNNKAMFQGVGTINGAGPYTFRVHATDGDKIGQADHFDIAIWAGTDTESDPIHRAKNELAGGNIVVHKK